MTTLWLETTRERWANLNPLVRLLIPAVILGLLGIFVLKPVYRSLKAWRLEGNLEAAKVAVGSGKMSEARDLSLTVLRAGDPRIDGYRILEASMDALRDPRHADIARALLSHPEGSVADRLTGFRGVAPEAPLGLLGQAWASLPQDCRQDPDFALIFAERLMAAAHLGEAASVLLAVPEAERTAVVKQQLARILIQSGKRDGDDEAQRMIAVEWPMDPAAQPGWIEVLESIPALSLRPDLLKPVSDDLAQPARAGNARNALMLARLAYAMPSANRSAVLGQAIATWRDSAPEELAKFLSQLGLHGMLLENFAVTQIAETPGLLPYLRDSLVYQERWSELGDLLVQDGDLMPESDLLMNRALVAAKSANAGSVAEPWNAAMEKAKFNRAPDAYLALYDFAKDAGMKDEAERALVEAILRGRGPLPLYADIKPLLESLAHKEQENLLLQICAIYLLFEPGNPTLLTQYAYLACLNDLADPASILKVAEPLAKAFPDALPVQCLLAAGYLSAGNPAAAAQTLKPHEALFAQLNPGFRGVFLVTQALNGEIASDDPAIEAFPWNELLPSERKKFRSWLKNGAAGER